MVFRLMRAWMSVSDCLEQLGSAGDERQVAPDVGGMCCVSLRTDWRVSHLCIECDYLAPSRVNLHVQVPGQTDHVSEAG